MSDIRRHQLTLFVPAEQSGDLELLRQVLDPVQHGLIPAHVTLCREDELGEVGDEIFRDRARVAKPVELTFGPPERFSTHGVLLPCIAGSEAFQDLRRHLLGRTDARPHQAHITLAHPRNPRAAGNVEENLRSLGQGVTITFPTVALIRQEGSRPWSVLSRYELLA